MTVGSSGRHWIPLQDSEPSGGGGGGWAGMIGKVESSQPITAAGSE